MKRTTLSIFTLMMITLICMGNSIDKDVSKDTITKGSIQSDKLAVLWTSGDPEVAKKMVMIYTYNAKKQGWFKDVKFIVWGPSSKLLSQNKELQDWIGKLKKVGVQLSACKWCADQYGVSDQLSKMGIEVIYYGKAFSDLIKGNWKVLTF